MLLFWWSSNMMQWDERHFFTIFWASVRNLMEWERYASKPAKYKLPVRILSIDVCEKHKLDSYWLRLMAVCLPPYLFSLLWSWNNLNWLVPFVFVKLELLELISALNSNPDHCCWLAGRQFQSWSSVTSVWKQGIAGEWRNYCALDQQASWISMYAKIVLSVSHLHSHSNFQAEILLENKDSQAKGETTVLQNCVHPSSTNSSVC